jgi:hypothetical protein
MLSIEVHGRKAIPLRAISYVTGGLIDGNSIAALTVDHAEHPYWNRLQPFSLDPTGAPVQHHVGQLRRMKQEMEDARRRGGSIAEVRACVPPGLYVWMSDVELAYHHFFCDCLCQGDAPLGSWCLAPSISQAQFDFAMEKGPEWAVGVANLKPAKSRCGRASTATRDANIAGRVRELIEEKIASRTDFKKTTIAEQIASEFGLELERASRVISNIGIAWSEEKARLPAAPKAALAVETGA